MTPNPYSAGFAGDCFVTYNLKYRTQDKITAVYIIDVITLKL